MEELMNNQIVEYVRDRNHYPVGCMVCTKDKRGEYNFGWSSYNKSREDKSASRSTGRKIARSRANCGRGLDQKPIPEKIRRRVEGFTNRCKRYFKDEVYFTNLYTQKHPFASKPGFKLMTPVEKQSLIHEN